MEEKVKEKTEKIIPRDFSMEEIKEINQYITINIPSSVLSNTLVITDNVLQKTRIFTIIYRLMNSAKNYVSAKETKEKLEKVLSASKEIYDGLFPLIIEHDNDQTEYGKLVTFRKIISRYKNFEDNMLVNDLIDLFLIFAEKQELINVDTAIGLNMETEEGREAYKKIQFEKSESPEKKDESEFENPETQNLENLELKEQS